MGSVVSRHSVALRLALLAALSGCDFLPGGGGGTGGGGGGEAFTKGFVFIRRDDKNVYASDQRNFMASAKLTTAGDARHPSLNKDGRLVVFVRGTGADSELNTVSTQGGKVNLVLAASTTPGARNFRNPVFTPDGSKVVFVYDEGTSSSIGVVNSDGSSFQKLAGGGALAYAGIGMYPDGSGVLAAAGSSTSSLTQLEKISLLNGSPTSVTSSLGSAAQQIVTRAVVSPDGTRAAFDARLASGRVRIFVIDLTTKAVRQLTDYPSDPLANDSAPCWVGNDKVGFSSDTGGSEQVYALPATGMLTSGGLQLAGGAEPWFGPNG